MVAVAGGRELEGRVLDRNSMVLGDAVLHLVQNLGRMPVADAPVDNHVGGQHRQTGRDLRGVQVVHFVDVRQVEDVRADVAEVQSFRGCFE